MQDRETPRPWDEEDAYWRNNFSSRPYTASAPDYSMWEGGYRYGYESAARHKGRSWEDVEPELARGWSSYEHRGGSAWDQVKHAVRDAWDRVTGHHPVGAR
jgi:hypothetical protein